MESTSSLPIGVFDSGVGGLTVMRSLVERLPHEHVTYLGDTARVPYGNRGAETIRRYALNATRLLLERGIKALVVACNTASAYALPALIETYDVPIIGVIDPVAERATIQTTTEQIGVLGTRGTVRSDCYPDAIRRHGSRFQVHQRACPLLVPLAEEGWINGEIVQKVARHYLAGLQETAVDTLILGCTHYPILRPVLYEVANELLDEDVRLVDSANSTADVVAKTLSDQGRQRTPPSHDTELRDQPSGELDFLFTDVSPAFVETAERFFGNRPDKFTHVDITDVADTD